MESPPQKFPRLILASHQEFIIQRRILDHIAPLGVMYIWLKLVLVVWIVLTFFFAEYWNIDKPAYYKDCAFPYMHGCWTSMSSIFLHVRYIGTTGHWPRRRLHTMAINMAVIKSLKVLHEEAGIAHLDIRIENVCWDNQQRAIFVDLDISTSLGNSAERCIGYGNSLLYSFADCWTAQNTDYRQSWGIFTCNGVCRSSGRSEEACRLRYTEVVIPKPSRFTTILKHERVRHIQKWLGKQIRAVKKEMAVKNKVPRECQSSHQTVKEYRSQLRELSNF